MFSAGVAYDRFAVEDDKRSVVLPGAKPGDLHWVPSMPFMPT